MAHATDLIGKAPKSKVAKATYGKNRTILTSPKKSRSVGKTADGRVKKAVSKGTTKNASTSGANRLKGKGSQVKVVEKNRGEAKECVIDKILAIEDRFVCIPTACRRKR